MSSAEIRGHGMNMPRCPSLDPFLQAFAEFAFNHIDIHVCKRKCEFGAPLSPASAGAQELIDCPLRSC